MMLNNEQCLYQCVLPATNVSKIQTNEYNNLSYVEADNEIETNK